MAEQATHGFTRRSFIKGAAALTATGALVGCSPQTQNLEKAEPQKEAPETQIFSGVCRGNCAGGCFLNVHVRDGQVVRTTARDMPDTRYNRICTKGLSHPHRIYSSERIQYPMKQAGERGSDNWERISWEEALDTIAEKWNGYVAEYGLASVGVLRGSGNYGVVNGQASGGYINRFLSCSGYATVDATVDAAGGFSMGRVMGMGPIATGNESADFKNSKTFLIWGSNPSISQVQSMHFITEAQEAGTKIIVIDPWFNATAAMADQFIPIKAGSDGALALAMMNIVVREGWQDLQFLRDHTVAPFLVKKDDGMFLRASDIGGEEKIDDKTKANISPCILMGSDGAHGEVDNVTEPLLEGAFTVDGIEVTTAYSLLLERIAEWPVERAVEETGLSAETIEALTKEYAQNTPSAIYTFYGIDHYYNAHWSMTAMAVLACLTGNVGKPGAFCGMNESLGTHGRNVSGCTNPEGSTKTAATYKVPLLLEAYDAGKYAGEDFNLKSIFITHANTLTTAADRNGTLEWMGKVEFLVGSDMVMTDTMKNCDIVLPAAHWFEKEDVFSAFATHPFMLYQEKAIEPAFESRADIDILNDLSDRLGFGDLFRISTEDYLNLLFDNDIARKEGMSYETLKEKKAFRGMPGEVAIANEGGNFSLKLHNRAEIYLENPQGSNPNTSGWDLDKERLPYWEPALQVGNKERLQEYPIQLLSEHSRFRTHSQWWEVAMLKEIDTEPFIKLSVQDAETYGIVAGDRVRAYNELGDVVLTAQINAGLPQGLATCPKSWEAHEYIEGSFGNVFTSQVNPFCANQAFFDCTVAIEKL
ncbi:molybdopterin-dependent oxidoreductase [Eggerthella lenta]|uniref:molybdopterin-dependent oxidoreductase n=1 Tax=Eggerthella lenta TaxID=84112 RepID=UPI000DF80A8A|nr:molybdopterin-dependent oxidoreductase [Eggerthella lenta]RDC06283.1 dehydrogenase [Eggerthella lenta]